MSYVLQNYIFGDTLVTLIYNLNIDLSQFLRKISVVESTQSKTSDIEDKYVPFTRIQP